MPFKDISKPSPGPLEILAEVHAISLNPIDPLYVAHPLGRSGRTIGTDFSGTVAEVGPEVPQSSQVHAGDRVAGFLQGACSANDRPGAFAEYVVIPYDLVFKLPENVTFEEAAGVSLVALTAAQGLWYRLGLKAPFSYDQEALLAEHPEWKENHAGDRHDSEVLNFFIYGASTSVGLYAAKMARLSAETSGRTVRLFGAASKARWKMLKAEPYSFDHLVDYRDQDWPEQIVQLSDGAKMQYVYDCISEGTSVARAVSTLSANGRAAIVRSRTAGAWQAGKLPVEPIYGAVWEGLGEEILYSGFTVPQSPAARAFAVEFYKWLGGAIGKDLKPVPVRLMPGGFERVVEDGFKLLGTGKMEDRQVNARKVEHMRPVSAEKLV